MERDELAAALGVSLDPTTGEIRLGRRAVARRLHPDRVEGGRTRTLMAEVNAACDRWIAEIRAARLSTPVDQPASPPTPRNPTVPTPTPTSSHGTPPTLRSIDVGLTVLLLIVIVVLTVVIAGLSAASVAAGCLLGSGTAALYLAILRWLASHRLLRR